MFVWGWVFEMGLYVWVDVGVRVGCWLGGSWMFGCYIPVARANSSYTPHSDLSLTSTLTE